MRILALDPGASSGYALINLIDDKADIYRYGHIDVDKSSKYQGDHCLDLMSKIADIIKKEDVEQVCVEDYFFSKRFANGSDVNAAYRTAIHIRCRELGVPYEILNITNWKKYVAGHSRPSKPDVKQWGKEAAKKLYMQRALWTRYGIRFPNHSISLKTGKSIFFRTDIVDVVAQAAYYVESFLGASVVTCSVQIPPDVHFKKPNKRSFSYNDL